MLSSLGRSVLPCLVGNACVGSGGDSETGSERAPQPGGAGTGREGRGAGQGAGVLGSPACWGGTGWLSVRVTEAGQVGAAEGPGRPSGWAEPPRAPPPGACCVLRGRSARAFLLPYLLICKAPFFRAD